MKQYFAVMSEDVRHERSLVFLISPTDPDILKPAKITDHEISIIKILSLEKLHRQRVLKEEVATASLEAELD